MGLLAGTKKALNRIESEMARKGFTLGDFIEGALPFVISSDAGAGGAATEAMTVTGLLATDTILAVTQRVDNGNSLPLLAHNTQINDGLTAEWSADPGAGAIIDVLVSRDV